MVIVRTTLLYLATFSFLSNLVLANSNVSDNSFLISEIRQLTFLGKRSGEGYFSTNGNELVYQSEQFKENPFYQIFKLNLKSGKNQIVSGGIGKTTCAWFHPNLNKILFSSTHMDRDSLTKQKNELQKRLSGKKEKYSWDYDKNYDLFEKNLNTGELRRLTKSIGYDAEASYSPSGESILFSSNRGAYNRKLDDTESSIFLRDKSYFNDLYLMKSNGSDILQLTNTKGYDGGPFFNSTGDKICWRRFSENGHIAEVYVMSLIDKKEKKITDLGVMSWAPFFHPSNKYIIFASNLLGFQNFELYIVDIHGNKKPLQVTFRDGFDGLPAFSPDGNTLSWTSNNTSESNSQIFLANWDHEKAMELLFGNIETYKKVPIKKDKISYSQTDKDITVRDARVHLEILASDEFEGRFTGTEGIKKAQDYIVSRFEEIELEPYNKKKEWVQEFPFYKIATLGNNNLFEIKTTNTHSLSVENDWTPLSSSDFGKSVFNEIVFAGFGIQTEEHKSWAVYDSFAHLDVKGKWIMVLRKLPSDWSQKRKDFYYYNSTLRKKTAMARDLGAKGIIFVSPPIEEEKDTLIPFNATSINERLSIFSISITIDIAKKFFRFCEKDFIPVVQKLNSGQNVMGFSLTGFQVNSNIEVVRNKAKCRNILGWLKTDNNSSARRTIVIGAHLDHIGKGKASSRAIKSKLGEIHPGADDNASGIAALLEIAEFLAELRKKGILGFRYDILFAAWSGEEIGLIGSKFFANNLLSDSYENNKTSPIVAYLNMDMVGRYKEKLTIHGVGSSDIWREIIQEANVPIGLNLNLQNDSHIPTDTTSFYSKGVPIISAFTGLHRDYHAPTDTHDKINFDKLTDTAKLFSRIIELLTKTEKSINYIADSSPRKTSIGKLRSYLGTIPDYSQTDKKGVLLSGVSKNGPADLAGVKSNDLIISLAGKKIETIYDYTDAISICKPNIETVIRIERKGTVLDLKITPKSR